MPIIFSWVIAAFAAAFLAWIIGKVTLGLRSDYLAIATLGISEIVIAVLKHEEWLSRGVKNVTGLPRPVQPQHHSLPNFRHYYQHFSCVLAQQSLGDFRSDSYDQT